MIGDDALDLNRNSQREVDMNECQEVESNSMTLPVASSIGRDVLRSFKAHLHEQQRQLRSALNRAHEEIRSLDVGRGDVIDDCLGNSSREALFKSYTQSWTQLRKVDAALQRIESGDFGTCSICGGEIGLKRSTW